VERSCVTTDFFFNTDANDFVPDADFFPDIDNHFSYMGDNDNPNAKGSSSIS
jgi:hypothetical protein